MFRHHLTIVKAIVLLLIMVYLSVPAWCATKGTIESPNPSTQVNTDRASLLRTPTRPKVGLALGGGGTRGAAHVGVLKVLQQEGIPIDYIAGTSMGAVVGGLYSAGISIDQLRQNFSQGALMHSFMTVPLWVRLAAAPILVLPRLCGFHPYDGLYRGNRFRHYLIGEVPMHERMIEELNIPFAAVALSLIDGKAHSITHGSLGYALQASSAVPGLRKPVQIGNDLFVDGGVTANVPVAQVRKMGADIVIAVDVDERFKPASLKTFRAIGSVSKRVLAWQLVNSDIPLLRQADLIIHPDVDGIGLISTRKGDAARAILAGEQAARDAMPAIKARLKESGVIITDCGANHPVKPQ